ncbi:MAG: hypothetical protein ACOX6T_05430 [Myxococcales bacterium]|jgi:hypothetical protein
MLLRVALSVALLLLSAPAAAKGLELSLGVEGGVSRYTGALGDVLKSGASWGVNAKVRATPWLSVGFAYSGSLNRLSVPDEDAPPLLVRDGASAIARLSPGRRTFEPFVEVGAGISRLTLARGDAGPRYQGDTTAEIPAAAGVMLHADALDVGLKLGYVALLGNSVYEGGGGHLLTGSLTLGASF